MLLDTTKRGHHLHSQLADQRRNGLLSLQYRTAGGQLPTSPGGYDRWARSDRSRVYSIILTGEEAFKITAQDEKVPIPGSKAALTVVNGTQVEMRDWKKDNPRQIMARADI